VSLLPPEATLRPSDAENLAGQETGRDHLSHSSISTQTNCLRKWGWRYHEHLDLIERPRPLGMGRAFHKGIELGDPKAGADALREAAPEFLDKQGEERLRIDAAIVRAAAALYLERFGKPEDEQPEYEYCVRLRSPWTGRPSQTFDLLGYADGVRDKGAWLELVEVKFVGRIDAVDVRRLPLDRQVSLACYGLWRATGKEVREVSYRFVKKPSIRQKQGESVDEFCARVGEDYAERPDFYSHDERVFRSSDDLALIEAELWEWAEQRRQAVHRDFYPRNSSHCSDYGGCQYIPLCTGDPDAMALYRRTHQPEEIIA
jgi:hypothetical protein